MGREEIIEIIMKAIEEIADIPRDDMEEDSAVMDDLEMNSFEILTMVAGLEKKFKLKFSTKALRDIITIADLADYIKENIG